MRKKIEIEINEINTFKNKALVWAATFSNFTFFNNNGHSYPHAPFKNILAVGARQVLRFDGKDDFEVLKQFHQKHTDWLIGYFGYDLKNQIEDLNSQNLDLTNFPDIYFYQPQHIIQYKKGTIEINSFDDPTTIYNNILDQSAHVKPTNNSPINLNQVIDKKAYINTVKKLRSHIIDGDVYEINFCMAFHDRIPHFDTLSAYQKLISKSPTPFSIYQKINNKYLLCASPERFLKKEGTKLITQPIKGTIKRGETAEEDKKQAQLLKNSEKERAENMMIVDLVRNDLARSCEAGSVKVEEMFGIYPFKHLFQMISTVTGKLKEDVHFIDAIKNAFPMGSMTGAPKIKSMQLIEKYERNKRGLFSGAMGYITPQSDFDFNVVIRSIFYNQHTQQLSFQAGSAITYDSIPEQEYEECMLKVKAIKEVLNIETD